MRKRFTSLRAFFDESVPRVTQGEVADAVNISRSFLCEIVAGTKSPGLNLALRLEARTGVPVAAMVKRETAA